MMVTTRLYGLPKRFLSLYIILLFLKFRQIGYRISGTSHLHGFKLSLQLCWQLKLDFMLLE
jgi:hypothetical protein